MGAHDDNDGPNRPLRVLVVDDSAVVRQGLSHILSRERDVTVEVAADPIFAIEKMRRNRPDVIVLDLEMPRMDGLTFLRKLMSEDPVPVVVCSGLAGEGTEMAMRALEDGAVEIIAKPSLGVKDFLHDSAIMLVDAVRSAAQTKPRRRAPRPAPPSPKLTADAVLPRTAPALLFTTDKVVAIGASTGGTEALAQILTALPPDCPPVVVVQHMPEVFTATFAKRLNQLARIEVKEAEDGDRLISGRALIAPGNRHTIVRRTGGHYVAQVADGPLVSRHRPSVNVLFRSVAQAAGPNGVGVILTGMGDDGADGLLEMRSAGAATIAQDERSCAVFGMPKEAIARGAVGDVMPLDRIAAAIVTRARRSPASGRV